MDKDIEKLYEGVEETLNKLIDAYEEEDKLWEDVRNLL